MSARGLLVIALVLSSPAVAAAGPVSFASGGPGAAANDEVLASIAQARTLMTVCWRKAPPATVKVELAVDAAGEVTKAVAKTKGAAAQCAAGILAVSTLASTGKKWKGVVELKAAAAGQANDAQAIHAQLAEKYQATLFACQDADPAYAGKLSLKLTVQQDGRVSEAKVTTTGVSKAVVKCLEKAAKAFTFDPLDSTSVVYEAGLSFAGGGKTRTAAGSEVEVDAALEPTRKGPIDAEAAAAVIRGGHAGLVKCAKKHKPSGVVNIRIAVNADGSIKDVKVKTSELGDEAAEACVVAVFKPMKFAKADAESVIVYPIGFDGAKVRVGN
jgi:hypothetical protein